MSVNTKIGLEATYLFEEETDVLLKVIVSHRLLSLI